MPAPRTALVDYGSGNLRSVARALERSGLAPELTSDPQRLLASEVVVLPGVGAFADAVASLEQSGLADALQRFIASGRPYLGLCLGLQVLFEEGDEHGRNAGLGILPGRVERFAERDASGALLRVPHIGWNRVHFEGAHPVLARLPERDDYYFVHSYRAVPRAAECVVGRADYGGDFAAAVAKANVFAVQFHPEKSQRAGRRLLDAFAAWAAEAR